MQAAHTPREGQQVDLETQDAHSLCEHEVATLFCFLLFFIGDRSLPLAVLCSRVAGGWLDFIQGVILKFQSQFWRGLGGGRLE